MKSKACVAYCLLAALLLHGCAAAPQNGAVQTPPATTIMMPGTPAPGPAATEATAERVEDYFPKLENVRRVYEGVGNEYASYVAHTEFTQDNKMQLRIENGGTVSSRVYTLRNGRLTRVLTVPESYVRESFLNSGETESDVLLMEPLAVGTAWDAAGGQRSVTATNTVVATPAGDFNTLEVTTQGPDSTAYDYYARGVGLVKSVYRSGDLEVVSSLSEIEQDAPFLQVVRLYYPGADGTGRYYREAQLAMATNMTLAAAMEEAYQVEPEGKAARVFTPGTRILSLGRGAGNVVLLDLNRAFITEKNGGAAFENGVLHSAADTFAELFQAEKVLLTIEGKPYTSANITMEEGEILLAEQTDAEILFD